MECRDAKRRVEMVWEWTGKEINGTRVNSVEWERGMGEAPAHFTH